MPTSARLNRGRVGDLRLRHAGTPLSSSRLKIGRLGMMRLKFVGPASSLVIAGVERRPRLGSITVHDVINDTPNTCTFTVGEPAPVAGQAVVLTVFGQILFAGRIERVEQTYEGGRPQQLLWAVTCQDYTRQLQRRILSQHYDEQSATTVILSVLAGLGVGTGAVQPGLPTLVGGIDFLNLTPSQCLTNIMQRIGGYWYVDYSGVVHAFLEETTVPPDPLVPGSRTLMNDPAVVYDEDITQLRTRILVTGGGTRVVVSIDAGATRIPVADASLFSHGEARSGTQRIAYTGTVAGGDATNVGSSVQAPASPPSASLSLTNVGGIVGTVRYVVTFKNAAGETLPSPASNAITGAAFGLPGAPGPALQSGLGRLVGGYSYRVSYVTDRGETTPGAVSAVVTAVAVTPPAAPALAAAGLGPLAGSYGYACTFLTAYGETRGGAVNTRVAASVPTPGGPSAAEVANVVGPLIGTYGYRVSVVTALGETVPGSATSLTVAAQSYATPGAGASAFVPGPLVGTYAYGLSFVTAYGETFAGQFGSAFTIPLVTSAAPTVGGSGTGQSIAYATTYVHPTYGESQLSARTIDTDKGPSPVVSVVGLPSGCGWFVYSTGTTLDPTNANLYKVAEMPVGSSAFTHTSQTGPQEGVIPQMGRWVQVTGIPSGPTGTIARRIYRTKAGGSTFYLVGEVANNINNASFNDVVHDDALTVTAPAVNTNGKQITVSSLPAGPSGTLARRLYRTRAGGSAYYLLAQVSDNVTSTFVDATPDAALTQAAPLAGTAGGETISVSVPIGPAGTTGRRVYRTTAGGAALRLLSDLTDNTTPTITDAVPDAQLAPTVIPTVNTAGGQDIALTITTGPAGTLARRVYRTKAGGAEHFLCAQVSGNTTTSLVDSTPDASLGDAPPLVNSAGASAVLVSLPTGPAGIAARRLYRTKAGGAIFLYVTEVHDNTTTTYLDAKDDDALGDVAPETATIGATAGDSSLAVVSTAALPTAGWGRVDSQLIMWTGKTATTLTGIPASGDGAIKTAIQAGSALVVLPMLTGVSRLTLPLADGDALNVFVQRDDIAAQLALVAREHDGDGVIEFAINDAQLSTAAAITRADAELALFSRPIGRVRYASRDMNTASGKVIVVQLPELGLDTTLTIQSVTVDEIGIAGPRANPRYTVEASTVRFSLTDMLRRLVAGEV